ncbi:hypothetical protein TNCV_3805281 [Trichonephila clavipes]|nr:hypothetical protein TNCV_3805281 [Trichonephila clavipes]
MANVRYSRRWGMMSFRKSNQLPASSLPIVYYGYYCDLKGCQAVRKMRENTSLRYPISEAGADRKRYGEIVPFKR